MVPMKTPGGTLPKPKKRISESYHFLSNKRDAFISDTAAVTQCSSLMEISEFHVFQLAHIEWYGFTIADQTMNRIFHDYLETDRVPYWVRQFTRKVIALAEEGKLSPQLFNITLPEQNEEDRALGQWFIILLSIITITFCIFISGYGSF